MGESASTASARFPAPNLSFCSPLYWVALLPVLPGCLFCTLILTLTRRSVPAGNPIMLPACRCAPPLPALPSLLQAFAALSFYVRRQIVSSPKRKIAVG
jgi:hypothetical protein